MRACAACGDELPQQRRGKYCAVCMPYAPLTPEYQAHWKKLNAAKAAMHRANYNAKRRAEYVPITFDAKPCATCGMVFTPKFEHHHYCSEWCAERRPVSCGYCGKRVLKRASATRRYKVSYCDTTCRDDATAERRRQHRLPIGPVPRTKVNVLIWEPPQVQTRVFRTGPCDECGHDFTVEVTPYNRNTRYCSETCLKRFHRRQRKRKDGSVSLKTRRLVLEYHGLQCADCGIGLHDDASRYLDNEYATIDHIVPKSVERIDELWNLRPLCRLCNSVKGAQFDQQQVQLAV